MSIETFVKPWSGHAVRHFPDTPGVKSPDIYDFRYCGASNENRWNIAGERTLYLAKEKDVALAENARHLRLNRTPGLAAQTFRRRVFRFQVKIAWVLDLCNPDVCDELSLTDAPNCFMNMSVARATAHFIRNTTQAQAIIVPSIAFPDKTEKWCLVLFLEKLPADPLKFLPQAKPDGTFQVT